MLQLEPTPLPLRIGESGVIRVGATRVTLDSVVGAFQRGSTAEEIQDQYPTLELKEIYAALTFYLHHQIDVDAYLAENQRRGEELRREIEARFPPGGIRERLLKRRLERPDAAFGR